jgi:hypothetical protein
MREGLETELIALHIIHFLINFCSYSEISIEMDALMNVIGDPRTIFITMFK